MKQIFSIIVSIIVLSSCTITCFATEHNEDFDHTVYGKYNYFSNEGIYTTNADNDEYSITTKEGLQISVESNDLDLILVVHQISLENKDFYDWFYNQIDNSEKNITPYDIYFLNTDGERIELSSEDIIKIQASNSTQHISKLSYEGKVYDVSHFNIDGYLSFKADNANGYYFVSERQEIHSPATGDYNHIEIWCSLMFLCTLNIIIMIVWNKLKKKN